MIRTINIVNVFILLSFFAKAESTMFFSGNSLSPAIVNVKNAPCSVNFSVDEKLKTLVGSRPNIIFVMTDDQGMGDLSCMGNKILQTPNIDNFYQKSTRFTQYLVSPTCAPSRAAIMSGRHEFHVGVTHTIHQRERMSLDAYTLPQVLQSAGYQTALIGKWHLGDEEEYLPQNRGFDEVLMHGAGGIGQTKLGDFPPNADNPYFDNVLLHNDKIVQTKGFCTDLFFQAALSWTKQQLDKEEAFFTLISLNAPHGPFFAPEKYKRRFLDQGYDEKTAGRYGMIENIDDNFGRMMKQLEKWNALENTLIIFTTDNGMSMPPMILNGEKVIPYNAGMKGRKNSPFEGGNHVPFFCYWKGVFTEGQDINEMVSHLDLYPTFVELAGAKLSPDFKPLEGRSLLPLLANKKIKWEDRNVFVHCGRWKAGRMEDEKYKKFAVRNQRWRYVNNEFLFDIENDPSEKQNVIGQHTELADYFKECFDSWWSSAVPLMINENLPRVKAEDYPLVRKYYKQLEEEGIANWCPKNF